jgi:hypothetical protein
LSSANTLSADLKPFVDATNTKHSIQDNCHNRATHPIPPDFRTRDQSLEEPTVKRTHHPQRIAQQNNLRLQSMPDVPTSLSPYNR